MSKAGKRHSKSGPMELEANGEVAEAKVTNSETSVGPLGVLLRIEEVTGVPSPSAGAVADLYWQLDVGTKRAIGGIANIVGSDESSSCGATFHDDFVIRRTKDTDLILVTLRSSALGNACFGKLVIDVEKELAEGRVGDDGESLVIKWLSLVPYFKSNNPQLQFDMKFRVVAKILPPPPFNKVFELGRWVDFATGVHALPTSTLNIMTDPKGTLPGVPIKSLLFLRRSAGADKIAKGSLLIDTGGESRVLVHGKVGRRRSFFSSGESLSVIFPGISAILDSQSGLMEKGAYELANQINANANPSSAPAQKQGLAQLNKASQRQSVFFRYAPKVTEFEEMPKTYVWALTTPVPHTVDNKQTLPASCLYANDGSDIFSDIGKHTDVAFGVRHVVNARCGPIMPAQTAFTVHPFGAQDVDAAVLTHESIQANVLLHLDYSHIGPTGKPDYTLELSWKGKSSNITKAVVSLFGSIGVGEDGSFGNEWKIAHIDWNNPEGRVLQFKLPSGIFGPDVKTETFATAYFVSVAGYSNDTVSVQLPKTRVPVNIILDNELAGITEDSVQGREVDSLQMNSHPVLNNVIAMPPLAPNETVTLYSEEGEPITFDSVFGEGKSGAAGRKRKPAKPAAAPEPEPKQEPVKESSSEEANEKPSESSDEE